MPDLRKQLFYSEQVGGFSSTRVGIEAYPRLWATSTIGTMVAAGGWAATAIYLPKGFRVNGITFFSVAAISVGTHQWFGLWNSALANIAASADDTSTAWAAGTAKRLALTAPFTTTYAGTHYVGLGQVATTCATIAGMPGAGGNVTSALRDVTPRTFVSDSTTSAATMAATLAPDATGTGTFGAPYAILD